MKQGGWGRREHSLARFMGGAACSCLGTSGGALRGALSLASQLLENLGGEPKTAEGDSVPLIKMKNQSAACKRPDAPWRSAVRAGLGNFVVTLS